MTLAKTTVVFSSSLAKVLWKNMSTVFRVYLKQGGVAALVQHTMQPDATAAFMNNVGAHICAVLNVQSKWDVGVLEQAFADYLKVNHFDAALVKLEVEEIGEEVTAHDCFLRLLAMADDPTTRPGKDSPATVYVFRKEGRTFVGGTFKFALFDGTSIFNFLKGLCEAYFTGKAPHNRPLPDDPKLALSVSSEATSRFGLLFAVYVGICEAFITARDIAIHGMFKPVPPEKQFVDTVHVDADTTSRWISRLRTSAQKPFEWLLRVMCYELSHLSPLRHVYLSVPISWQQRLYLPKVARDVVGHWMMERRSWQSPRELSATAGSANFYNTLKEEVANLSGLSRYAFVQKHLFGDSTYLTHHKKFVWFNQYGLREVHPKAGSDVQYFWGPNNMMLTSAQTFLMNVICVNGTTSVTCMSSTLENNELAVRQVLARLKGRMVSE